MDQTPGSAGGLVYVVLDLRQEICVTGYKRSGVQ